MHPNELRDGYVQLLDTCENEELYQLLDEAGLSLARVDDGLVLSDGTMELLPDFEEMIPRLAPGKLSRELLVCASKVKGIDGAPRAIDATAGLGEDSILLAAAGFDVTMFESNPVIAALLADACERALGNPRLSDIVKRMHVIEGDSVIALGGLDWTPDVIYLDPMFPERSKSAAVKKKFQLLHRIERYSDDEERLLEAAQALHPRKVVIKRPLKGPYLGDIKPSYSLRGKAVRYDVIVGV